MEAHQIRSVRNRLNENQTEFGRRFGVSPIAISYWESGRSKPSAEHASKLSLVAKAVAQERRTPFRPIQYLGSKQRLCVSIAQVVEEVCPGNGRVGDLFSGSGVVSHFIGANRAVTAIDVQHYSAALSRAMLTGKAEAFVLFQTPEFWRAVEVAAGEILDCVVPLIEIEEEAIALAVTGDATALVEIIEAGSMASNSQFPNPADLDRVRRAFVNAERALGDRFDQPAVTALRYYGGPYFSYRQAAFLDAFDLVVRSRFPEAYYSAQGVMLSVASEMVNTVGKQFAQPMKLKKRDGRVPQLLLDRTIRDRSLDVKERILAWAARWEDAVLQSNLAHEVVRGDSIDFLDGKNECEVYYADPPYTIDHYSRFYHVLETLILRDTPILDVVVRAGRSIPMRGIYRSERVQSAFSIPSQASTAFDAMFFRISSKGSPLVLSYSPYDATNDQRPRSLPIADIISIGRRHFRRVETMLITEHRHRKLNSKDRNFDSREDAERLIILEV